MKKIALIVIAGLVVLFFWFSLYTIDETEQAIILEFGKPMGETISSPGLHFKLPWQSVIKFENRILEYDVEPQAIITKDKKKLEVDNYARWRIADPLLSYLSFIHISEPTRPRLISYAVFSLKKKTISQHRQTTTTSSLLSSATHHKNPRSESATTSHPFS